MANLRQGLDMAERKNLTDANVAELEKRAKKYEVWDAKLPHLCVRVEVSGKKTSTSCIRSAVALGG